MRNEIIRRNPRTLIVRVAFTHILHGSPVALDAAAKYLGRMARPSTRDVDNAIRIFDLELAGTC